MIGREAGGRFPSGSIIRFPRRQNSTGTVENQGGDRSAGDAWPGSAAGAGQWWRLFDGYQKSTGGCCDVKGHFKYFIHHRAKSRLLILDPPWIGTVLARASGSSPPCPQGSGMTMDALTLLLERRSCSALQAPAPAGAALEAIVRAALRVPDFLRLRPYQFLVAEGEGLERLGRLMAEAAERAGRPPEVIARARTMPQRAPMVIVVVSTPREHKTVSVFEQQLTAGCAVMAMQMAALAQGFGGVWRSGWPMAERELHLGLGLRPQDQIVGFLYLGTPAGPAHPLPEPPDLGDYVRQL